MPDDRLSDNEREELMDNNRLSDREAFDLLGATPPSKFFYGPLKMQPSESPIDKADIAQMIVYLQQSLNAFNNAGAMALPPGVASMIQSRMTSIFTQLTSVIQYLQSIH